MSNMTTAQSLAAFYKELNALGVPQELAQELVRDAGHTTVDQNGLSVIAVCHSCSGSGHVG